MSLEAGLDTPKRSSFDKEQKARLAALFIVAVLAIMSMTPLETHSQHPGDYMLVSAVMPAVIAWLFVRERPARRGPALLRGVSLVLALVGAGGLARRDSRLGAISNTGRRVFRRRSPRPCRLGSVRPRRLMRTLAVHRRAYRQASTWDQVPCRRLDCCLPNLSQSCVTTIIRVLRFTPGRRRRQMISIKPS